MMLRLPSSTRTATHFPSTTFCRCRAGCAVRLRGAEPVVRVARGRTGRSGVGGDVRSDYGGLAGPMSKALKTVGLVLGGVALVATGIGAIAGARSEEHTSELQSLMRSSYAVCCLQTKN